MTPDELAKARELVDEIDRLVPMASAQTFPYHKGVREATREGFLRPQIDQLKTAVHAQEGVVFWVSTGNEGDMEECRIVREPTPKVRLTARQWVVDKLLGIGCALLVMFVMFAFLFGLDAMGTWIINRGR